MVGSSFILCIALFPYHGDSSGAILEVPSEALLHLSVVSRSSLGGIREGIREVKEKEILTKVLFWWLGVLFFLFYVLRLFLRVGTPRAQYSKCHPRHFFILGSSLVLPWSLTRMRLGRYKGRKILILGIV